MVNGGLSRRTVYLSALLELHELLVDGLPEVLREFQLRQVRCDKALLMLPGGGQPPQRAQFFTAVVVVGNARNHLITRVCPRSIQYKCGLDGLTERFPSRLLCLPVLFDPLGDAALARHATAQPGALSKLQRPVRHA